MQISHIKYHIDKSSDNYEEKYKKKKTYFLKNYSYYIIHRQVMLGNYKYYSSPIIVVTFACKFYTVNVTYYGTK